MAATQPIKPLQNVLLFANGDLNNGEAVQQILFDYHHATIVAADGGAEHALRLGMVPEILIGDMDSISPRSLEYLREQGTEILKLPPEKDETDLELALTTAAQRHAQWIRVIGALGDRFDQTTANAYLLNLPELADIDVRLVAHRQTIWLCRPGEHALMGKIGDTISLVPIFSDVTGIETQDLQYPLHHETLYLGPARGISNVIVGDHPHLHFEQGILMVVHTIGRA